VLDEGLNVVVLLQRRDFDFSHVVLIYGISSDGKHFKIKDSAQNPITEIPINRLTYYQSLVLEQDEDYFKAKPGMGFNLSENDLKNRLFSNLKKKNSSLEIDFDQTDEWMIHDTGYSLRFNKTNNDNSKENSIENTDEILNENLHGDSTENSDENLTESSDENSIENSTENPDEKWPPKKTRKCLFM